MTYHRLSSRPKAILEGQRMTRCITEEWHPYRGKPNVRVQTRVERPVALIVCLLVVIGLIYGSLYAIYLAVTGGL